MARTIRRTAVTNPSLKVFAKTAENYVEQTFARFPSYGSSTGRHEFDAELERPTLALYRAHEKLLRETLTAIEDLPEVDFRGDAWLDRRALLAELRTELWSIERAEFRKNPERWASGATRQRARLGRQTRRRPAARGRRDPVSPAQAARLPREQRRTDRRARSPSGRTWPCKAAPARPACSTRSPSRSSAPSAPPPPRSTR